MNINYQNVHLSKSFYMHDSVFSGYNYDYEKQEIRLSLLNKNESVMQHFVLTNVVLSQFQDCAFWGGGNAVYYICCYAEHPFFEQLHQIKAENIRNVEGSRLDEGTRYIVFELQVNSGYIMHAICESVYYEEIAI